MLYSENNVCRGIGRDDVVLVTSDSPTIVTNYQLKIQTPPDMLLGITNSLGGRYLHKNKSPNTSYFFDANRYTVEYLPLTDSTVYSSISGYINPGNKMNQQKYPIFRLKHDFSPTGR